MCANNIISFFILALTGAAFSASIKGGHNGTKGGWEPPKDWDWSVTPGRLIPVSEATDDLPTPGYRMSQLQQRIPPNLDQQPFPIMNMAVNNSTAEGEVVVIGQKQTTTEINEPKVTNDISTTQRLETTENLEQSTPKNTNHHSDLNEQELILLQDEPVFYQEREHLSFEASTTNKKEKIPVVEETMEKVELPEICSISGIGCRDPKPVPQEPNVQTTPEAVEEHTEVLKHPKVVPHPHVPHHEVHTTDETASTEQSTEQSTSASTVHYTSTEEHTSGRDQLSSDSHHIDQQVVQQILPVSPSEANFNESQTNNTSETYNPQETVTIVAPQFNFTAPTVVHSVVSSVSEHIGFHNMSQHETDSTMQNNTDSQHTVDDALVQQEQQVQQQQIYSSAQLPQQAEVHQVDEQKLLEIANSWGSSSDNSSTHSSDRRMDEEAKEDKHEDVVTEVSIKKEDMPNPEAVGAEQEVKDHPTEQKNSTESPSIGDRIESYWKAATGYVSKALNL